MTYRVWMFGVACFSIIFATIYYTNPHVFGIIKKQKIVIDTDMALDDWGAILLMLGHPTIEVIGISVTGTGEAYCKGGIETALYLLDVMNYTEIPVSCGTDIPIQGFNEFPKPLRDNVANFYGVEKGTFLSNRTHSKLHSADLLIKLYEEEKDLTLLVLGPLTNVALMLQRKPHIKSKLGRIYIMGGAVKHEGNAIIPDISDDYISNKLAEWNIFADPLSAQETMRAGLNLFLVPLDGTSKVPVTQEFFKEMENSAVTPEAVLTYKLYERSQILERVAQSEGRLHFWDQTAALALANEDICIWSKMKLDVWVKYDDLHPWPKPSTFPVLLDNGDQRRNFVEATTGNTYITEEGKLVNVCMDVRSQIFYERYLQIINRKYRP